MSVYVRSAAHGFGAPPRQRLAWPRGWGRRAPQGQELAMRQACELSAVSSEASTLEQPGSPLPGPRATTRLLHRNAKRQNHTPHREPGPSPSRMRTTSARALGGASSPAARHGRRTSTAGVARRGRALDCAPRGRRAPRWCGDRGTSVGRAKAGAGSGARFEVDFHRYPAMSIGLVSGHRSAERRRNLP